MLMWVHKVALPLLEGDIAELPLECWSVYVDHTKDSSPLITNFW